MLVSELKDKLTDSLNKVVRKYSARVVAKVFRVKPPTVWQWSAGERENPLTKTLEFLMWLKHRDPEMFTEIASVFMQVVSEEAHKTLQIKEFAVKLFKYYIDDHKYDVKERAELEREFKRLLEEVKILEEVKR
ncbi:hypothetical protein Hydth_0525 [Hydrogenobacter thermophilus TK-6]|uniref:Uncharacterized protein n=1 Tax=Hydrogenobacter thermophilus (strain DSM 6534 / IAM 12695 / TK-6) TaxID=608538 RepID=D3DGN9_HYDTT|nr:hypothetical protein [Hydrogenobacter thermophilus]ADO44925.1 hypothetical protein Hydth_0525 [Hydrogenobacter thermophilus TK-6]BAI68991.1 hypothetical protein HTH_0528 [Hydrogenobacter thermophilus TK-6]